VREREPAGPQLCPVGQELLLVERLLVDEAVRARGAPEDELASGELDALLDQS
jgi:hypothetical protein